MSLYLLVMASFFCVSVGVRLLLLTINEYPRSIKFSAGNDVWLLLVHSAFAGFGLYFWWTA